MQRFAGRLAAGLVAAVAVVGIGALPAEAVTPYPYNCEGYPDGYCYFIARWDGTIKGVVANFPRNNMFPGGSSGSSPFYMKSAVWMNLGAYGTGDTYMQVGLTAGWRFWDSACLGVSTPSCYSFTQYWGDTGHLGEWTHPISIVSADGGWDEYAMTQLGGNYYEIAMNGAQVNVSTNNTGQTTAWEATLGGEQYAYSVTNPAGSFGDTTQMQLRTRNTSNVLQTRGAPSAVTINSGTHGFNGVQYNPSDWWWNKQP